MVKLWGFEWSRVQQKQWKSLKLEPFLGRNTSNEGRISPGYICQLGLPTNRILSKSERAMCETSMNWYGITATLFIRSWPEEERDPSLTWLFGGIWLKACPSQPTAVPPPVLDQGPRASHHLKRFQPVCHYPQKERDVTVSSAVIENGPGYLTISVLHALTTPFCVQILASKPTTKELSHKTYLAAPPTSYHSPHPAKHLWLSNRYFYSSLHPSKHLWLPSYSYFILFCLSCKSVCMFFPRVAIMRGFSLVYSPIWPLKSCPQSTPSESNLNETRSSYLKLNGLVNS